MRTFTVIFCLTLAVFTLTGCAGFKGRQLEYVPQSDIPEAENKPSLNVNLEFQQYLNGSKTQLFRKTVENSLHNKFINVAKNSGSFSQVSKDLKNPDLKMKIEMKDEGSANMGMAVLTGLSLYTIPSSATDNYVLQATVVDRKGEIYNFHMEDYVTQWQHIFLIPVMPFKLTIEQVDDVQNNIFRTLILRMHQRGIIDGQQTVSIFKAGRRLKV